MPQASDAIDLGIDGLDPTEVEIVLGSHFLSSSGDATSSRLPTDKPRLLIERHPKTGALKFRPGPAFDPAEVDVVRQRLTDCLRQDQGLRVAGSVGFSTSPVEGSFAPVDGSWLLQPAPPEAPRPTDFAGGGNPLIVYLRIASSADWMVVQRRHSRAFARWLATMNALLVAGISGPPRFISKHWVLRVEGVDATAAWAQEWYGIPGFVPYPDHMPAAATPVNVVPDHEYYGRGGAPVNYPLSVPAGLAEDLRRVGRLAPDNLARFLNSGRWRATSNDLWSVSFASWYIAQVAAIETLLTSPPRTRCPRCGQEVGPGPTALFKDFMERYAMGPGRRTELDQLYSVRSSLAHGVGQLVGDAAFGMAEPAALQERGQLDLLRRLVAFATVNWLRGVTP